MAVTIPSGAKRQPSDALAMDAEGGRSASFSWKGPFDDLESAAESIAHGDAMPSDPGTAWKVDSWELRRTNADYGVLTINCKTSDATDTSQEGGGGTLPFRDVISVKSVRNDVSILAYCGSSPSQPNRAAIERWMREPDPKLAAQMKYTDENGSVVDFNEEPLLKNSIPLLQKIMKGTERVIRFYPQITRRRSYYAPPTDLFQKLSYIDTPPSPSSNTLGPNGVSTLISAHQWLKVQDDCDEQQDRTWMRTESWIGIATADSQEGSPWDADLYGPSRWKMPKEGGGS